MTNDEKRNIVGEFGDEPSARAAVRSLERAGFNADAVAVITGNPRRARELTGSRSPQGAAIGLVIALLVFAGLVVMGGPVMWSNPVAIALGVPAFVFAGVGIGWLAGRARIFVGGRAAGYESVEDAGDRLVSVSVAEPERDRARRALHEAGAVRIREEGTEEAA